MTGKKASKAVPLIYRFGQKKADGTGAMKSLLGGKGANLHEMTRLGLPVPPGFTITTDVCKYFYKNNKKTPADLEEQVEKSIRYLEKILKKGFGDAKNPLLVSVRSGAQASMPGMMDTILNLGLNDYTVQGLIQKSGDARFAFDSYRRFVTMYADVVLGIHSNAFEATLEDLKHDRGYENDQQVSADEWKMLVQKFKQIIRQNGRTFPEDPWEQLMGSILAVFQSWMNPRAITYRKLNNIPEAWGTAVNIQSMVFGNLGDDCATGVAFTRDPSTGEKKFYGEYLINAQGEDVVAGIRTPNPIVHLQKALPKAYKELDTVYRRLEKHYGDMQDIEFTIERGKLYMLQTRNGKRSAAAAIKIAVDLVREKQITEKEAVQRVTPDQLDQLLHPRIDPKARKEVLAKGLPASPGAAAGQVVFDPDVAESWHASGKKVLLMRVETSPEDIHGMSAAEGILTARGGMTSHAAVVARGMGKPCVAGCSALKIDYPQKKCTIGSTVLTEGDFVTIDGSTGEVIKGTVPTILPTLNADYSTFMKWVDQYRVLEVRANADTPQDAKVARGFGAKGIGLCRTEHMFFGPERIDAVREMILADTLDAREKALLKILPMQRSDFVGIFQEMAGFPVTIRLLDPPLHEFIPQSEEELEDLSKRISIPLDRLKRKASLLHEFNPMLGHRGCRLGVSYPEIYRTQVRAITEAQLEIIAQGKPSPLVEIMIPLVGDVRELELMRAMCEKEIDRGIAASKFAAKKDAIRKSILIGTMIELPRAALTASEIAKEADFFSFGTNDLTQTTYGLSRDDSGIFLRDYLESKVYERDPFAFLDPKGVGRLMKIAIEEGRQTKPGLKMGICGEHGGEPSSVALCHEYGLNYVSCSPYRVPLARLAAAQAALKSGAATAVITGKKKSKTKKRK